MFSGLGEVARDIESATTDAARVKKLIGWLIFLVFVAAVLLKADVILEAGGQPELAKQAAELRDRLLTQVMGKDGKAVEEEISQKAKRLGNKAKEMTDGVLGRFKESMGFDPDELAKRAVDTFKGAAGMVPEDFAAYYEALKAQGEKHASDVTEYALTFSEHYSDEIAPELVGYWNEQIASGTLAKDKLELTKQALAKVRAKMRPLLTDHLRVLERLESKRDNAKDEQQKQEIKKDIEEVEAEIQRSFEGVPANAEVLDSKKKASERLALHLESTEQTQPAKPGPTEAAARTMIARVDPPGEEDPAAVEAKLRKGVTPWLGTKYRMGTNTLGKTTDCSGFVGGVMKDTFKLGLPRTSQLQYKFGDRVKRKDLLPGDLVFFDMKKRKHIDHVGVYVGKDDAGVEQFAHASFSKGVRYDSMSGYYSKYYWGAARVLDE